MSEEVKKINNLLRGFVREEEKVCKGIDVDAKSFGTTLDTSASYIRAYMIPTMDNGHEYPVALHGDNAQLIYDVAMIITGLESECGMTTSDIFKDIVRAYLRKEEIKRVY